jgi:hypothetical protein
MANFNALTGSGQILKDANSWAGSHDAGDGDSTGTNFPYADTEHLGTSGWVRIVRSTFTFDTSSIPIYAVITAATFTLTVYSKTNDDNDGQDYMGLVKTTPASPSTLSTADFDQFGTSLGATSLDITSDISAGDTNSTWTLNSTGFGFINKGGYTTIGLREGHDIENTDLSTGVSTGNGIRWRDIASGGTVRLSVTYNTPTTSTSITTTSTSITTTSTSRTTTSSSTSQTTSTTTTSTSTTSTSSTTTSSSTSITTTSTSTTSTSSTTTSTTMTLPMSAVIDFK